MKIKIIVTNSTGAVKKPGELDLVSGIIKYDLNGEYGHIANIGTNSIHEVVAPVIKEVVIDSPPRSANKKTRK